MRPYVEGVVAHRDVLRHATRNAGLRNAFGGYDETPADMARVLGDFSAAGSSTWSAAAAAPRRRTSPRLLRP